MKVPYIYFLDLFLPQECPYVNSRKQSTEQKYINRTQCVLKETFFVKFCFLISCTSCLLLCIIGTEDIFRQTKWKVKVKFPLCLCKSATP
jgi:hypothetical protein